MKRDIAQMREEAKKRLDALTIQLHDVEEEWHNKKQLEQLLLLQQQQQPPQQQEPVLGTSTTLQELPRIINTSTSSTSSSRIPQDASSTFEDEAEETDALYVARRKRESSMEQLEESSVTSSSSNTAQVGAAAAVSPTMIRLLDNTRWRVMLNIGREPSTWMPKTWGVSGERLYMHLELEFTSDPLYERDDFLNGVSGAKVLKVVHNQARLAPSMQEGGRHVRVRTGGWRVAPGEGPMGTSVLRYYVDLEEETRHQGSDVYCPAGRVYFTCGYFPMAGRTSTSTTTSATATGTAQHASSSSSFGGAGGGSLKDSLRHEYHELEAQYEDLATENELDHSLISFEKIQRGKRMMDLRMHANKISQKMNEAQVREPDKSLLRLSRDQSVGLTKEGGVCCKVSKGLAFEYHILGKFEVGSMENREHSDYRELLP
jgi:hypothetical protein